MLDFFDPNNGCSLSDIVCVNRLYTVGRGIETSRQFALLLLP